MRASATTLEAEMTPLESRALADLLRSANLTGAHLEIGTAAGGTLKSMMSVYPAGRRPNFVVVDTMNYFPDQKEAVARNLRSVGVEPSEVDFRIGDSWAEFLKAEAAGDTFDFILIDASHKLNHVTRDLSWTRMLAVGGYVCMHDYAAAFPGVMQAANRFLRRHPNYTRISTSGSLLIMRKNSLSAGVEIGLLDRAEAEVKNFAWQMSASVRKRLKALRG